MLSSGTITRLPVVFLLHTRPSGGEVSFIGDAEHYPARPLESECLQTKNHGGRARERPTETPSLTPLHPHRQLSWHRLWGSVCWGSKWDLLAGMNSNCTGDAAKTEGNPSDFIGWELWPQRLSQVSKEVDGASHTWRWDREPTVWWLQIP